MAAMLSQGLPWHSGEDTMHRLTKVPYNDNPNSPFLTPRAASQIQRFPLMAVGTLGTLNPGSDASADTDEYPWCTLWGGEAPLAQPVGKSIIGVRGVVDGSFDPVAAAIFSGKMDGEVVRCEGPGRMISALSIDLERRNRVKLYGRMVAGSLGRMGPPDESDEETGAGRGEGGDVGQLQLVVKIEQSLANCPKYINCRSLRPAIPQPNLISDSTTLCPEALALLDKADTIFVSSAHAHEDMDLNHRGGPPGFVRVASNNDGEGAVLVWPEYSGNNLYQTLGNLQTTPKAGVVIPDFETGDVLYLTGDTDVYVGSEANDLLPHSTLAVRLRVKAARFVSKGLPFRGQALEMGASPYNPRVRYLKSEKIDAVGGGDQGKAEVMAKLIKKEKLTPTINRYRFALSDPLAAGTWKPGQYAALSFYDELYMGYSHMRDDDPTSLNDDFLRTFTISSHHAEGLHGEEFELTIRKVGNVTNYLSMQNERAMFEVPLKGFGGDFVINQGNGDGVVSFIAAGIGITPLIGQLPDLDPDRLRLLWTVGIKDIGLVDDTFKRFPNLPKRTRVFLTGNEIVLSAEDQQKLENVTKSGAVCEKRRMEREDVVNLAPEVDEWYLCAAPAFRKAVQAWLPGKSIIFENFDY